MPTLRILHLEDNPLDAELMLGLLTDAGIDCDVLRVETEDGFVGALKDRNFDLIVSDFSMPGFDGRSALDIVRRQMPDIPFIFVSGTLGEEAAVDCLIHGATDYVLKHRFSRLVPAIQRAQRDVREREERKQMEAQLLRTQRMDSLGTLAGGIAHDLNNVLSPILMAVQILKDRFDDASSQKLIQTLESSAKRGAGIVRQVLAFARGVEGEHIPVQPRNLLLNMEKMLMETFPKYVRIESELPRDLWVVVGDPTQLDQILLNLCVNARDAMPQGGVLKLRAENKMLDAHYARLNPDAKPGPHVMLEVTDTGHGIPPAVLERIFEPFFTTKEIGVGTGLGLSTTLAIIKSHRGFVNVYSEVGRGTSFKVYLPAKDTVEAREASTRAGELRRGNGELILVVDDEAAVRDITEMTLSSYGYQVITANNGAEALGLYAQRRNEIRAVLLDTMMPIMDGAATAHALMSMDPKVRIIAASGLVDNAKILADYANVRASLAKPYTAETLLTTLNTVLNEQK